MKVARHRIIPGYPQDTRRIVSQDGFGRNEYSETSRDLVVVTAPGPGSGKLATCLSQVFHDHARGIRSGAGPGSGGGGGGVSEHRRRRVRRLRDDGATHDA